MNRLERYFNNTPEPEHVGDYVIVAGAFGWVAVTHDVARRIGRVLNRWRTPRWIVFPDRVGSMIRIRPRDIRSRMECTLEQRAAERRLERAKRLEDKADGRDWQND